MYKVTIKTTDANPDRIFWVDSQKNRNPQEAIRTALDANPGLTDIYQILVDLVGGELLR